MKRETKPAVNLPWADLHTHSSCSDGSDTPVEVVQRAAKLGMAVLALTDHDSLDGLSDAQECAKEEGLTFVNGVEISTIHDGVEVHITGLGISQKNPTLNALLDIQKRARSERFLSMAAKLEGIGFPMIGFAEEMINSGRLCGRMHLAHQLNRIGTTRTVQEGFDLFLNPGKPAWTSKRLVCISEGITAIKDSGGAAFVAHPGLRRDLLKLLPEILLFGPDGIEAFHISHGRVLTRDLLNLAKERGLLVAGGSDCHGTIKGRRPEMGKVRIPLSVVEPALKRLAMDV